MVDEDLLRAQRAGVGTVRPLTQDHRDRVRFLDPADDARVVNVSVHTKSAHTDTALRSFDSDRFQYGHGAFPFAKSRWSQLTGLLLSDALERFALSHAEGRCSKRIVYI